MRVVLVLAFIFLSIELSFSCINEFSINSKGDTIDLEDYAVLLPFHIVAFDKKRILHLLEDYNLDSLTNYKMETQSDIGVKFLKLGEFEKALPIFERLVEEHPNQYEFNANLGTTYELLGQNELALKYIRKGLEINPYSHNESEWIHVQIIEAKLEIAKNPNWLEKNKIIDLEACMPGLVSLDKNIINDSINRENNIASGLETDLYYQLETRVPFVPSPDLFTALMYLELAEFTAKYVSTSRAHGHATVGQYYAPTAELKAKFQELIDEYKILTEKHYNGIFNTDSLPSLTGYLDTTLFYEGKNGVNWLKVSDMSEATIIYEDPRRDFLLDIIVFLAIASIVAFISYRNRRKQTIS